MPYENYVQQQILSKLHMDATTFQSSDVPAANRAIFTRTERIWRKRPFRTAYSARWADCSPPPPIWASTSRSISPHGLPRDDAETGPVRRSSVREMSHLWTPANLTVSRVNGMLRASESGYGYGLRVTSDCRFEHIVAHGGGLPGFGSYMSWLPEHGVAIFAMTNLTYAGPAEPASQAWDVLLKTGGLRKRELPASPILTQMRDHIIHLWKSWDNAEVKQIAAMNLLLDAPAAERTAEIQRLKADVGKCSAAGPVIPENWLRGHFNMTCAKGTVGVFYTLAPTQPPGLQHLSFRKIVSDAARLGAPTGPPAGVSCPVE